MNLPSSGSRNRVWLHGFATAVALLLSSTHSWGGTEGPAPKQGASVAEALESRWGIQVSSLRVSAGGYMVDFRYKVIDPVKAAKLGKADSKPSLIDEATGTTLLVPKTPKVGPLRQTAEQLDAGKIYWMLFANRGQVVKSGSIVTIAIGDFRVEHLEVE